MLWHWQALGSGHGRGTHLHPHPHPHFASRLKPISSHVPSHPISLRRPFPLSLSLSFHPPPCDLPVCFLPLASLTLTPNFLSASHLPSEPYVSHTLYHFTDCRLLPCLNTCFLSPIISIVLLIFSFLPTSSASAPDYESPLSAARQPPGSACLRLPRHSFHTTCPRHCLSTIHSTFHCF